MCDLGERLNTRANTRTEWTRPCFEGAPLPRWLASWRRDYEGYEIVAKVGDALAVANQDHSLSGGVGGGMSINGGVINTVGTRYRLLVDPPLLAFTAAH